jgi:SAM-dependent methyltransferase
MKEYMPVVTKYLNKHQPALILDCSSGSGWLKEGLSYQARLHGLDLYDKKPNGYEAFAAADLDEGLKKVSTEDYDMVVSCEGIEHLGNPLLFLKSAFNVLKKDGHILITTPNTWHPASKVKYLLNGFFPSFPSLAGKIVHGSHMHITPWTFPHLYLYLSLAGFKNIAVHALEQDKPKHGYEKVFGFPQYLYCKRKLKKSKTIEERHYWSQCLSKDSLYGRRLVVSANKIA